MTIRHSLIPSKRRGRRDRYRMVVTFTTTYASSADHNLSCELE